MSKAVEVAFNPPTWGELCKAMNDREINKYSQREQLFTTMKQMETPNYITTLKISCKKDAAIPQISKYRWPEKSLCGPYKINFKAHEMKLSVKHQDHAQECVGDCLGLGIISRSDSQICLSMTPVHVALLSAIEICDADGNTAVKLSGIEALAQIFADHL